MLCFKQMFYEYLYNIMYVYFRYLYRQICIIIDLIDIITGQGYKFMLPFNVKIITLWFYNVYLI